MIASLSGTILKIEKDGLVIGVGGVGIRVSVPRTVLENVGGIGRQHRLHTHLIVREQELSLYGFETEEDLQLFEILLGVSGIGPKVGLAILSTLSPELLKSAIMQEESLILFQLRDKLDLSSLDTAVPFISDVDADVIDILTGLGFSIVESQSALQNLPREAKEIDERVQFALQFLDQK